MTATSRTLDVTLSPAAPPPVPDGWAAVLVEAYRVTPYGCSDKWEVGKPRSYGPPRTLDEAIALAFEHVLMCVGLENCGVDIVIERGDDEGRIAYSGIRDVWDIQLPE